MLRIVSSAQIARNWLYCFRILNLVINSMHLNLPKYHLPTMYLLQQAYSLYTECTFLLLNLFVTLCTYLWLLLLQFHPPSRLSWLYGWPQKHRSLLYLQEIKNFSTCILCICSCNICLLTMEMIVKVVWSMIILWLETHRYHTFFSYLSEPILIPRWVTCLHSVFMWKMLWLFIGIFYNAHEAGWLECAEEYDD